MSPLDRFSRNLVGNHHIEEKDAMICFMLALLVISAVSAQHTYDRTDYVNEEPLLFDTFPEGFQWGAATSAHQVSRIEH